MKAPVRLHGPLPDPVADAQRAALHRLWRQRLLRAVSIALAALLIWGGLAMLNQAEGDLSQVRAPSDAVTSFA